MAFVVTAISSVHWLQHMLADLDPKEHPYFHSYSAHLTSTLMSLMVFMFDKAWRWMSFRLTTFENHKYENTYGVSLALKLFLFAWVNDFNSLFYDAFIKGFIEPKGCPVQGCLPTLRINLCSFVIVYFGLNLVEAGFPFFASLIQRRCNGIDDGPASISYNFHLVEYTIEDRMDDWLEVVVQFWAVAMFSIALPLLPLLILICAAFEMRLDAIKLTRFCRRPYPATAAGITVWNTTLKVSIFFAVTVNVAVCVVNLRLGASLSLERKLVLIIIFENVVIALQYAVEAMTSGSSDKIPLLQSRRELMVREAVVGLGSSGGLTERHKDAVSSLLRAGSRVNDAGAH
eukprot:GHVU01083193.1.p2 GENE.GHVU01083193.1~~GHVU01083193.1.p2  ORF type:complete len:344 (-),score=69.80 GHVU01083193.1:642-1673(-)